MYTLRLTHMYTNQTHMHTHIHTHIHACTQTCTLTHAHTNTYAHTCTHEHTKQSRGAHTLTHPHTHTYTITYILGGAMVCPPPHASNFINFGPLQNTVSSLMLYWQVCQLLTFLFWLTTFLLVRLPPPSCQDTMHLPLPLPQSKILK